MAKQELEGLDTKELQKKKKFAAFLLGIMFGLGLVNVVVAIMTGRNELFAVAAALVAIGLPMFLGFKRINEELSRRADG